ncbi:lipase chaperone [Collimonas pratensis]|uniref:lipase secretion chaperone n=1 Tax=Collimonas pratensis TaxID=279113 RepID=UPI00143CCDBF|nr:lipase secretion chaperone [Collimonas pratensis]NKI72219.1 lipase chaperone [Collimonas pratensis]
MSLSNPAGGKRRSLFMGAAVMVAAICAAAIYWLAPASTAAGVAAAAPPAAAAAMPTVAPAVTIAAAGADPATPAWPQMLQGTAAPLLPVNLQGRLERKRDVRDFFDYFLTAQSVLNPRQLDALVGQQIKLQLGGKPAAGEAAALWENYRAYLAALTQLAAVPGNISPAVAAGGATAGISTVDAASLQSFVEQRAGLRRRFLAEWSGPFFGEEDQAMLAFVARARIAQDKTLSEAERKRRLQEIAQNLPPGERAVEQQEQQQQQWFAAADRIRQQNLSPEAMRTQVAELKGAEFADRFVAQEQQNRAWQANYDQYAAQRDQVQAQGLAPQDQEAQLVQLRAKFFSKPGDALRAAGLDQIAQLKH